MSVDRRITGGTVVTQSGPVQADVLISDGRIVGLVGLEQEAGRDAPAVDATGKLVLPGMIDVHVHTREPGYTHKEDILTTT